MIKFNTSAFFITHILYLSSTCFNVFIYKPGKIMASKVLVILITNFFKWLNTLLTIYPLPSPPHEKHSESVHYLLSGAVLDMATICKVPIFEWAFCVVWAVDRSLYMEQGIFLLEVCEQFLLAGMVNVASCMTDRPVLERISTRGCLI